MEIVKNFPMDIQERDAFLRFRRAHFPQGEGSSGPEETDLAATEELPEQMLEEMKGAERLLLAISSDGAGKIVSSHNFIEKGRGGKGIKAMRGGGVVAFLAVELDDQVMLTTDSGQSIRCNVSDISIQSRHSRGVRVINLAEGEEVMSVARIADDSDGEDESGERPGAED